ncbi:ornithine cyclodeaminase family protein [Ancylobacter terrae]|uniref:ornithine cyclodeaminase family protein n=1 Tax=Ancylobacter sp. sgz301288 TaxID=3342077 RepID=UPI00385E3CB4
MPRQFDAEEVHAALGYARLVEALRAAFRAEGERMPTRLSYSVGTDAAPGHLLCMPAWRRGEAIGVKLVNVFPGNTARGMGAVSSLYVLFDGETGSPSAIIDGEALTNRRTAAASALASSYLSRPDSRTLFIVGTGHVAAHLAGAHRAVRPIERVLVWGRRPAQAEVLAERLCEAGFATSPVAEIAEGLAEADIVSCATTSREPLVRGDDVRPGTHVDLIGAFTPQMRESDDALVMRSSVFVDTRAGAFSEAGDLLMPHGAGLWSTDRVRGELHDLCAGLVEGRRDPREITLFKSVGAALEDLAAARLVVEAAAPA